MKYTKEYLKENNIAIRCQSRGELARVSNILDAKNNGATYFDNESYVSFSGAHGNFGIYGRSEVEETVIMAKDYLKDLTAQDTRKIIGYRAPFDIETWGAKKGKVVDINCKVKHVDGGYVYSDFTLVAPAEIVEQWEPVYEDIRHEFSSLEDLFVYFKSAIITCHKTIHIELPLKDNKIEHFYVNKDNYAFTPEFEQKLKDMGINV